MATFAQKQERTRRQASSDVTWPNKTTRAALRPEHLLLRLQRTIGNQAMLRLLRADAEETKAGPTGTSRQLQRACACGGGATAGGGCSECGEKKRPGLQTKLKVNEPGDVYEREADRVAEQVLAAPAHSGVGGAPPRLQRIEAGPSGPSEEAPGSVDRVLASPGIPLEPLLRQDMEQRLGSDFSGVRVHTSGAAAQSARDVNAKAYTVGRNVVFGAGEYAPGTHAGRRLIAHELAHVVQQGAGQSLTHAGSGDGRSVQRQVALPRLAPRVNPRSGPRTTGVPRVPPIPPVYPIPADRPAPHPEADPESIEDRKQRRCGTYALPETVVTFSPGPKGQGLSVTAMPLTLCPGNTRGSKPLDSIYQKEFECIRAAGESGQWVRGHLLHGKTDRSGDRHLHGPGDTAANLIIISQSLNQTMRAWIEDAVLKLVYGPLPHALWLDVWVDSYYPGLEFFADSISMAFGPYRTASGMRGDAWKQKQFVNTRKPPHCPAGGSVKGPLKIYGFQSTLSIYGGGRQNRLNSRNVEVSKSMGGLIAFIDAKLVPPKCTVEHYYVELVKEEDWAVDKVISKTELSAYPDRWPRVLMWRQLSPGEYYLRIWREDEGVFKRTPGCKLEGDITVDTFSAPAPEPLPPDAELA